MPIINRPLVGIDNDEEHHEVITKIQTKNKKDIYSKKFVSIPIGSTVVVQWEDGDGGPMAQLKGKVIRIIVTDHTIFASQNRKTSHMK